MSFRREIWACSKFSVYFLFTGSLHRPPTSLNSWSLQQLTTNRRGCAAFIGRNVSKLKAKGGGKFKYMSENEMLELASKFAPYR